MSYKVAISSTDGKVVNQHFGHTEKFLIVQVDEKKEYRFLEDRSIESPCNAGGHDEWALEKAVLAVSDCRYVLCAQIGGGAGRVLEIHGIQAITIRDFIENAMKKIIAYDAKQNKLKVKAEPVL
ncbi:Predicted Fe-Mo cluster-binding protein, NifX family [Propionispira arboris]|uniref:Predicted Fe-Mo cluster-binding protein, NifX family n=1 Tax=Propionispira arboris TaxID=84035 RepID=A0A1H7AP30_9FIRM|nr:NifB/NifX family molybdenum-iron cluster-binding protein [Propionispira arboris]SEJ67088.1 Predicted Fe-Mo cluster-binding protein, NifX family [Propionispira arboris]